LLYENGFNFRALRNPMIVLYKFAALGFLAIKILRCTLRAKHY
jgi:hypothetical protein